MGSSFSNLQVFIGSANAREARAQTLAALEAHLRSEGFTVCAPEAPADRIVALGPARGAPWVAVYDQAAERLPGALEAVSRALSSSLGRPVVATSVSDSDLLSMALFEKGELRDRFESNPDYFQPVGEKERAAVAGRPELWKSVLEKGHSASELREAWDSDTGFAETIAGQVATVLGMDPGLATVGYGYLEDEGIRPAAVLRLRGPPRSRRTGPPRFEEYPLFTPADERLKADRLGGFSASCLSLGGSGKGVLIEVGGSAIDGGLLLPLSASIHALSAGPEAVEAAGSFSGSAALELADYRILGAPAVEAEAALGEPGLIQEVFVQVRGKRPGKGEVVIRVSPLENPRGGVDCRHTIEIADAPPRPRYGVHEDAYDALDTPRHLFALASFRSLVPEPMLATAGRWLQATAPSPEAPVWFPDLWKSTPVRLSTLLGGEGWAQLPAKLEAPARLLIHRLETPEPFAQALAGAELQSGAGPNHEGVHLCFWSELEGLSAPRIAEAKAALRELFDSQLREGNLLSAFVVRWDRRSERSSVDEPTTYEYACDAPPDLAGRLEWCSSFVRGLGEQMWLGPSLVERIDLEGLSQVASIECLGQGVRVDAKAGHTWHDFEEPLDPILPRQEKRRPRRRRRSSKKAD